MVMERRKNKIFYPLNWLKLEGYQQNSFLHRGIFNACWGRLDAFHRFLALDHGQYPWGSNRRLCTMAVISCSLKVNSNSCNTCLTLYIIIGLWQNDVIMVNDLLKHHKGILFNYFNSTEMRDADTLIPILLHTMQLADKVCIIMIRKTGDSSFLVQDKHYGNPMKKRLFIVHSGAHFFLGCPLFLPPKIQNVAKVPTIIRKYPREIRLQQPIVRSFECPC